MSHRSRMLPGPGGAVLKVIVAVLLLAPFVGTLWVGSYAKKGPELWGFPFFSWYSLLWVLISSCCTGLAYWLVAGRKGGDGR
jgi:hypothetical protein